jgi:hypothetical protein
MRLRPVNRESFVTAADEGETLVSFVEFRHGRPGYLVAGRAARRAGMNRLNYRRDTIATRRESMAPATEP